MRESAFGVSIALAAVSRLFVKRETIVKTLRLLPCLGHKLLAQAAKRFQLISRHMKVRDDGAALILRLHEFLRLAGKAKQRPAGEVERKRLDQCIPGVRRGRGRGTQPAYNYHNAVQL